MLRNAQVENCPDAQVESCPGDGAHSGELVRNCDGAAADLGAVKCCDGAVKC